MSVSRGPALARALLSLLLPAHDREYILGDLEEQYADEVLTRGRFAAGRHYWLAGFKSIFAQLRAPHPSSVESKSTKGAGRMDRLRQDLRLGIRNLLRKPALTLAIVATLALAIGVNSAMFSVVHAVLLRPLPFPEPDRLVTIWQSTTKQPEMRSSVSDPNFRDWQQARSLSAAASYRTTNPTLTGFGDPEIVPGGRISEDFFRVLGEQPIRGRAFTRQEIAPNAPSLVIISEAFWRSRLNADPAVLGRSLVLGGAPHEIVGVAPDVRFPEGAQLWLNERIDWERCGRGCVVLDVIGRLAPDATIERAQSELTGISNRISAADPGSAAELRPNVLSLEEYTVGSVRRGLVVLLGAVGLVLLIACANVANLLLSGAAARQTEMAVRASLGAARGRIVQQLFTESILLSLLGGALGLALAQWCVQLLGVWTGDSLPRFEGVGINMAVLGFTALAMILAALLFGLAPAIFLARTDPGRILTSARGTVGAGRRALLGRAVLLTSQVALSIMLLIGTGLLLRTLQQLRSVDLGFSTTNVQMVRISLPGARYAGPDQLVRFFAELQRRIAAIPGVESVAGIAGLPLSSLSYSTSFQPLDRPQYAPGETPGGNFRPALPGYFETLQLRLLQGRTFTHNDTRSQPAVVVVNQSLAKRIWPGQSPIGKQIQMHASTGYEEDQPRTVVGVVADVRSVELTEVNASELYIPHAQSGSSQLSIVMRLRPGVTSVRQQLREEVRSLDPLLPLQEPEPVQQAIDRELLTPRLYSTLLGLFASLALVLSAIGLYGIVGYQVALRRREVGVRLAVGARVTDVVRLLALQGLRPAIIGVVIGTAGAAFAVRVIGALLFNTPLTDPLTWISVIALVCGVVVVASVLPALKTASIAPAEALRSD
jgi:putative ABC transport system permease protein